MACWRCGTCHDLILSEYDRYWHTSILGHEAPYDDEA